MTNAEMIAARAAALNAILNSDSRLKVVVAGPGTGKTHTFSKVLDQAAGEALVLSFLGNLVADLGRAMGDRAEVKTFHAFCRKLLHAMDTAGITRGVDYYPEFRAIEGEDVSIVLGRYVRQEEVERAFMLLDDSEGLASNAIAIGNYYDAVGHTDSVYRIYQALAADSTRVPAYELVLVDEYQDFSRLEVELIRLLSQRSSTVIAGDDDQALYGFRHASPEHLRLLVQQDGVTRFELPFCSRCPAVLVEATHQVVAAAQGEGRLNGRIDKAYHCYMPDKAAVSAAFPRIIHASCTVQLNRAPYMSRYVAQRIAQIPAADIALSRAGGHPTVLVVGPTQFIRQIGRHLIKEGVPNVSMRTAKPGGVAALDGYLRLQKDEQSRLGWRILLFAHQPAAWHTAVRRAVVDGEELVDVIDPAFKTLHLRIAKLLADLADGTALSADEIAQLEVATGISLADLRIQLHLDEVASDQEEVLDAPSIVITSLVGAKGLQAEHVFVIGVNEGHFPISNSAITDEEVCCLLVALTRARTSCTLVSCGRIGGERVGQSRFVRWLDGLLEPQRIDAAYWRR